MSMRQDIAAVWASEEQLRERIEELGRQITKDYEGKEPLFVGVLKGCFVFMADLVRACDLKCTVDFMVVSSYGSGTKSSGVVKILKDLDTHLEGYDVLIVEDILDSGRTLQYIIELLRGRHPNSVRICTLFDKPEGRQVPIFADYVGLPVPNEFIVGYGLDYDELYRNLPYIGILKPEVYGG